MTDPLTVYLVAVAAMVVCFAAVYVYYELDTAAGRPLRTRGVTQRGIAAATVGTLGTIIVVGLLGDVAILANIRALGYATLAISIPLALGLLGLNSCHTFYRRWRRLHPDTDVPTGAIEPGDVACMGEVTDDSVGTAPVTDREAVCWSWSVEVLNPHGVGRQGDQFVTVEAGDGGVTFTVDDGSGPVRVDPAGATLDLTATRRHAFDADERPPDGFPNPAPTVERTHDDKPRTYEESVAVPGDQVAVAGTARRTDEGLTVGGPDSHVAIGSLSTVATRYRNKAALYGFAGLLGTVVAVDWLGALYGVF